MRNLTTFAAFALWLLPVPFVRAQCDLEAKSGPSAPGPSLSSGFVTTVMWDPDGSGPRGQVLVLGGSFTMPSVGAANLVQYDLTTGRWSAFPSSPNQSVAALAVLPNGHLVVGGVFAQIGSQPLTALASFDGQTWSSIGNGAPSSGGRVQALQVVNNDLYVGGLFTSFGGVAANGLARWDGSQWRTCGAFTGEVKALAARPSGRIVVGGQFPPIGYPGFANIAEFDGTSWQHYGAGLGSNYSYARSVAVMPNGDVVAAGWFNLAGGVPCRNIARWDGTAWSAMDVAFDGTASALLPLPNGELLASMTTTNMVPVLGVGRWTGSQWVPHAPYIGAPMHMRLLPDGRLLAVGDLDSFGGERVRSAAIWDGATWHALGYGFDGTVTGIVPMPNGDVVAFGSFGTAEGQPISWLARSSGQRWWPMHSTAAPVPWSGAPACSAFDNLGRLWLAGSSGGTGVGFPSGIGIWTGSGWQSFGIAVGGITSLVLPPDQMPIVGCETYSSYGQAVARWNGAHWVTLGQGLDAPVRALLRRRNGDLIVGGEFLNSGSTPVSRIARWDGSAWHPLGTGVDGPVRALAELPNGDLIAAGDFITDGLSPLNLVARWDGVSWRPLGAGLAGDPGVSARALLVLPDGDLLVGGSFLTAGGYPARGLAHWDGSQWHAVAGGIDGTVRTLALSPNGDVFVGGDFSSVGVVSSAHFARLRPSCPATAMVYGTACIGSGGPLELMAADRPWIGATYRATCFGVAPMGIGFDLFGVSPAQTPLSSLHPAAVAGCLLLTQPAAVTLRLPVNGAIESTFALPADPLLVGLQIFQQVLVGELGTGAGLTALAGSNGLSLTVGAF